MEAGGERISHHSQIDSPWVNTYTEGHFPDLISHFPYHWLHYEIFINIFILICILDMANNDQIWRVLDEVTFQIIV